MSHTIEERSYTLSGSSCKPRLEFEWAETWRFFACGQRWKILFLFYLTKILPKYGEL